MRGPTGRAAEYAARSLVRVEFYTADYHVSGDVEVSRWRLADVLNDAAHPFVLVQNTVREPLPSPTLPPSAESARAAPYLQIAKHAVLFAIPYSAPDLESASQQYLAALYAERTAIPAIVTLPPFEIRGMVHLRQLARARQALEELPAEFIPLTHLEAAYAPDPRVRVHAELAVVNRPAADLFSIEDVPAAEAHHGFRRP